mmetsp:Transcript_128669/g.412172  ORF Transcript_128669/g.412172 Transcript_128669/m.412172 type:complete len:271 (-) Transcript_128669:192-1004(-)
MPAVAPHQQLAAGAHRSGIEGAQADTRHGDPSKLHLSGCVPFAIGRADAKPAEGIRTPGEDAAIVEHHSGILVLAINLLCGRRQVYGDRGGAIGGFVCVASPELTMAIAAPQENAATHGHKRSGMVGTASRCKHALCRKSLDEARRSHARALSMAESSLEVVAEGEELAFCCHRGGAALLPTPTGDVHDAPEALHGIWQRAIRLRVHHSVLSHLSVAAAAPGEQLAAYDHLRIRARMHAQILRTAALLRTFFLLVFILTTFLQLFLTDLD